ncbi:E3 ubiquitin-protein ligase SIRP1-like [Zingiber officinale]|nr:E3 ubiquitin-protein ligase SIRP1-like [Zingiber officinale]
MSEGPGGRYWCHACNQLVNPVMEPELKCPLCDDGFVEEMESRGLNDSDSDSDSAGSDRSLALWAPILREMLGGSSRSRREADHEDSDLDREFENFVRRRRRRSAIIRLLQSLQDDLRSGISSLEGGAERERDRDREGLIVINHPFNQAIILQGSLDANGNEGQESNNSGVGAASLGDYFIGPGLDILLQHLADNDPNKYGTPPAKKEAIDALPTVRIEEEAIGCSICLEDFDVGLEAKEMPCKHKFHSECILPWLQLHSSCPLCRSQLPADESKISNGARNSNRMDITDADRHNNLWVPVPWPFNGLFSLSASQNSANSTSNPPPSSSSNPGNSNSHSEEN